MTRLAAVAAGAALAASAVAGCSGGDDHHNRDLGYCRTVKEVKNDFRSIADKSSTVGDMRSVTDRIGDIAEAAPSRISEQWTSLHVAIDTLVSEIEDSGAEADAMAQDAIEQMIRDEPDEADELIRSMQGLRDEKFDVEAVKKQVKDKCNFKLK